MVNPKPSSPDSDGVKIPMNGPSEGGVPLRMRTLVRLSVGDVIMIPPGVAHGWIGITDHVDYLSVRPDPDHVFTSWVHQPCFGWSTITRKGMSGSYLTSSVVTEVVKTNVWASISPRSSGFVSGPIISRRSNPKSLCPPDPKAL